MNDNHVLSITKSRFWTGNCSCGLFTCGGGTGRNARRLIKEQHRIHLDEEAAKK